MKSGLKQSLSCKNDEFKKQSALVEERINTSFASIFQNEELDMLAKSTKFVQRSSSRLTGKDFVKALLMASEDPEACPLSGIIDNIKCVNATADMTISALRQRINSPNARTFLEKVFVNTIERKLKPLCGLLNPVENSSDKGALQFFSKVLLHDSSRCPLNTLLQKTFKGSGGAAGVSEMKIDFIYEMKASCLEQIVLTDVRQPDQSLSKQVLNHVCDDVLVIQDLGYFEVDTFEKITDRGGHYLSRLLSKVLVYLKPDDQEPIELGVYLSKLLSKGEPLDLEVYISQKKMKTRLIAYPVPEQVFQQRRRLYNQKNKGRNASAEMIARQRFTILITSVPKELWQPEIVGTVYKVRWQIELIFKVWKSQLKVHFLKGTDPDRILCLTYARMLAAALILSIQSGLRCLLSQVGVEISLTKLVNWLRRQGRFSTIIINGFIGDLWEELMEGLILMCKERGKRKSSLEDIENQISYLDTFKKCA